MSNEHARNINMWEFNYLIIDELTKQTEETFQYLLTCVRSSEKINPYTNKPLLIPTKILCCCNPGGIGHQWVKSRFIDKTVVKYDEHNTPVQTRDIVEYIEDPAHPEKKIRQFIRFIPATYKDNPYLNRSYVANLSSLPEHLREMDMYGNWNVVAGRVFDLKEEQKIPPVFVAQDLERLEGYVDIYISIDWGYNPSYHCALWHAVFPDNRVATFKQMYGQNLVFEDFVKQIASMSEDFEISGTCLPHDMFRKGDRYRDDSGAIIGETKADVFEKYGLIPLPIASGKGKVQMRMDKIHSALDMRNDDGIFKFRISKACPDLIEELEVAVHDDIDPTQLAAACRDHAIDAYGLFMVFYSDDIEPLGFESVYKDNRGPLQKLLEEDEKQLEQDEEDMQCITTDNYTDF